MRRLRTLTVVIVVTAIMISGWAVVLVFSPIELRPWTWLFPLTSVLLVALQTYRLAGKAGAGDGTPSGKSYVIPQMLPPSPAVVGRKKEISQIVAYLTANMSETPPVVIIHGESGIGKTALAIDVARQLADTFKDGVLFAWLGRTDADYEQTVLREFVVALQSPDEDVPLEYEALLERYRELTEHQRPRVLVVLDDATDAVHAASLLPVGACCAAIVTSRDPLTLPNAWSLAGPLKPLDSRHATRLLEGLVGQSRIDNEPEAARKIVSSALGSPLALNLAGASLVARPNWSLESTLEGIAEAPSGDSPEPQRDSALDLSFSMLTEQESEALLLLGLLPSRTFEPWMLAALMNLEPERIAWRLCDRLVHGRLLEHMVNDATGVATYRLLEHVFEYVSARQEALELDPGKRSMVMRRLDERRRERSLRDLSRLLREQVYFELERGNISGALNSARGTLVQARTNVALASTPLENTGSVNRGLDKTSSSIRRLNIAREAEGLALAALAELLSELGSLDEAMEMAAAARKTDTDPARPRALRCIGNVERKQRNLDQAYRTLLEAGAAAQEAGQDSEQVRILRETAIVLANQGRSRQGLAQIARAQEVPLSDESRKRLTSSLLWAKAVVLLSGFEEGDAPSIIAEVDQTLCDATSAAHEFGQSLWIAWIGHQRAQMYRLSGRFDRSCVVALRAAEDFASMRHRYAAGLCRLELARSYMAQGNLEEALPVLEEARQTLSYSEDRWVEAETVVALAETQVVLERVTSATLRDLKLAVSTYALLGDGGRVRKAEELLGQARLLLDERLTANGRRVPPIRRPVGSPGGLWAPSVPIGGR